MTKKLLKPLGTLQDKMTEIDVNNLSETIQLSQYNSDITNLTTAFNGMTQKLNDSFALQQNFSANAAHELRTPVAILRTKLDIFQKKFPEVDPDVNQLIQIISKQTNRLNDIITSLLELNNSVQSELFEKIPLDTMLETILTSLAPNYPTIHLNKNFSTTIIKGHAQLLQQAFYNIIENSFKYNEEFGSVSVGIHQQETFVEISIVDTGIGISDAEKQKIFAPFYRVDASRSRDTGGSGLGLTLAKSIIEKHHGTIQLKNNSGQGTVFIVSLPLL
ncbi:HAMP domain-containing sensor histidine kinase [Enterococcus sp. LJL90]